MLSQYFSEEEFRCRCGCGIVSVDSELLKSLDWIRTMLGRSVTIASGCRCPPHNIAEGGSKRSAHITTQTQPCRAADIECADSLYRADLLRLVLERFARVGIAQSFLHVDVADDLPTPRVWVY